jgi:hypothetical protein
MEIITRGEGIPFEPDLKTIERLNTLANTESSKLYCPSFTKTKSKRKQGRPKKQLPDVSEGVREVGNLQQYEPVTDVDRYILTTPVKHPTPTSPGPTLGELLQSAPILGKKRSKEIEPHVSRDIFAEDIAASFVNRKETLINNLITVEQDGGVKYHFFHKNSDGTRGEEPVYTACLNYRDLKYDGKEMFSFAAQTSIKKALALYPEAALKSLISEIDGMLERKVWKGVLYANLTPKQRNSILHSSTIVKEKFNLDGDFLLIKTRLVTGGDGQNKSEIPERLRSATTTATSSVNTVASIAAARNMEVAIVDVKQAYLNADMEGEVFMWIP